MSALITFRKQAQDQLSDYVRGVIWSSNGKYLAAISAAGEAVLWKEAESPQRVRLDLLTAGDFSCDCLGFSANSQFLAVGGQAGKVWVWDVLQDVPKLVLEQVYPSVWIDHLAWHPVEERVAIATHRQVQIWDLQHQKQTATLEFESSSVLDLAWHPAGEYLAVSGHGGVKIWDLQTPEMPLLLFEVPGASLTCRWSADGQYLASGNLDRTLSVLAWEKPPPWLMQGFPGKVSHITWADGAALLAAACVDGITVWRREGGNWNSHVLTEHQGFVNAIAFQPQTQLLASGGEDQRVLLWKGAKKVNQTLKGLSAGVACLAWHPLGHYLVGGGMDGQLMIWCMDTPSKGFG
ncbi:WD40 repeat domain-containing protein [Acaryochloris thomasi]|uniref:WD40 repeat domain-containing protein n=1 Tax=Acaryochloris thomasi TaxID=2929456 RepID=UPI0018F13A8B|nr:hypothetical protein [Acaryochloris thomasi]